MNAPLEPLLINDKAASAMLGISSRTLYKLRLEQGLPCIKVGAINRYSPEALRKWISQQMKDGAA